MTTEFRRLLVMFYTGLMACPALHGQTRSSASADIIEPAVETLVCVRHGEKPPGGLGQLTCQGLNRALALPNVLLAKYPGPQFMFAPDPAATIDEGGGEYCYVRPLMTIEPTAVYCGLPVNTDFGYIDISELEEELQKDAYHNATIYIAWEHIFLRLFALEMLQINGGNPAQVPPWPESEYDMIFVIRITRQKGHTSAAFTVDHEDLNNLSPDCPQVRPPGMRFGVSSNQFGLTITGASNALVVVQADRNPTGCQTVAGGPSEAQTPGQQLSGLQNTPPKERWSLDMASRLKPALRRWLKIR
jgi:hypothetical protein